MVEPTEEPVVEPTEEPVVEPTEEPETGCPGCGAEAACEACAVCGAYVCEEDFRRIKHNAVCTGCGESYCGAFHSKGHSVCPCGVLSCAEDFDPAAHVKCDCGYYVCEKQIFKTNHSACECCGMKVCADNYATIPHSKCGSCGMHKCDEAYKPEAHKKCNGCHEVLCISEADHSFCEGCKRYVCRELDNYGKYDHRINWKGRWLCLDIEEEPEPEPEKPVLPEKPQLPKAEVTPLGRTTKAVQIWQSSFDNRTKGDFELDYAAQFKTTESSSEVANKPYADWNVDFVVKVSKDIPYNGTPNIMLAGYYSSVCDEWLDGAWLGIPVDFEVKAGTSYRLMDSYGFTLKYGADIVNNVQDFQCGIMALDDTAVSGVKVTVSLYAYETDESDNEIKAHKIDEVSYTF